MDHLDMLVSQREGLAICQILNDLNLIEKVRLIGKLVDVDLIQILVEKPIVEVWMADLWSFQI
jgi:hypothetical protein